jgi:hypothetical protein
MISCAKKIAVILAEKSIIKKIWLTRRFQIASEACIRVEDNMERRDIQLTED